MNFPVKRELVRFLFRHRGLRVLGHLLRRTAYQDRRVLIGDFDGDMKFYCYLDEHIGSQIYWRGAYSWPQLRVLDRLLRSSGSVFFDVGANQGEFTLFAAKRLAHGRVLAFEPLEPMYRRLELNVSENGFQNVDLLRLGLWDQQDRRRIYSTSGRFKDGSKNEGLGTLFSTDDRESEIGWADLVTLDDFCSGRELERLDVMKIDVEGAEFRVLSGGLQTIERYRPAILMEIDRDRSAASGVEIERLFDLLRLWYTWEVILPAGRTKASTVSKLGRHQDVLFIAK